MSNRIKIIKYKRLHSTKALPYASPLTRPPLPQGLCEEGRSKAIFMIVCARRVP